MTLTRQRVPGLNRAGALARRWLCLSTGDSLATLWLGRAATPSQPVSLSFSCCHWYTALYQIVQKQCLGPKLYQVTPPLLAPALAAGFWLFCLSLAHWVLALTLAFSVAFNRCHCSCSCSCSCSVAHTSPPAGPTPSTCHFNHVTCPPRPVLLLLSSRIDISHLLTIAHHAFTHHTPQAKVSLSDSIPSIPLPSSPPPFFLISIYHLPYLTITTSFPFPVAVLPH